VHVALALGALLLAACSTPYGVVSGSCFKSTNIARTEGQPGASTTISAENCVYPAPVR